MAKDLEITRNQMSFGADSLQWSPDGQLAMLTATGVLVIEPTLEVQTEEENGLGSLYNVSKLPTHETSINSLQNVIAAEEKMSVTQTCTESIVTAIQWSSLGVGSNDKCVLAVLTNTSQLLIYERTSSDYSEWKIKFHINRWLIEYYQVPVEYYIKKTDLIKLRIHSLSWSEAVTSGSAAGTSLLAMTSEASELMLVDLMGSQPLVVAATSFPAENYPVLMRWSPWLVKDGVCESILLVVLSDNSCLMERVVYDGTTFLLEETANQVVPPSRSMISTISWFKLEDEQVIALVASCDKLTILHDGTSVSSQIGTPYAITCVNVRQASDSTLQIYLTNSVGFIARLVYDTTAKIINTEYAIAYNDVLQEYRNCNNSAVMNDDILKVVAKKVKVLKAKNSNLTLRLGGLAFNSSNTLFSLTCDRTMKNTFQDFVPAPHQLLHLSMGTLVSGFESLADNLLKRADMSPVIDSSVLWFEEVEFLTAKMPQLPGFITEELHRNLQGSLVVDETFDDFKTYLKSNLYDNVLLNRLRHRFMITREKDVSSTILTFLARCISVYVSRRSLDIKQSVNDTALLQSMTCLLQGQSGPPVKIYNTFLQLEQEFAFSNQADPYIIESTSGHKWPRCSISLLPLMDARLTKCSLCGCRVMKSEEGGALLTVLLESLSLCIYCGAHFES